MAVWESFPRNVVYEGSAEMIVNFAVKYKGDIPQRYEGVIGMMWLFAGTLLPAVFERYTHVAMGAVDDGQFNEAPAIARQAVRPMVVEALIAYSQS